MFLSGVNNDEEQASPIMKKIGQVLHKFLTKFWIWVVAITLFGVAITGQWMTSFRILYMALFLFFIITFQVIIILFYLLFIMNFFFF